MSRRPPDQVHRLLGLSMESTVLSSVVPGKEFKAHFLTPSSPSFTSWGHRRASVDHPPPSSWWGGGWLLLLPPTPAHLLICSLSFFALWPKHPASGNCTAWGHCPLIPGWVMDSMDKSESGRERRGPTTPAAPSQFWWLLCLRLLLEAPLPSSCGPWEQHPPLAHQPQGSGGFSTAPGPWALHHQPCLQGEPSGSSPAG